MSMKETFSKLSGELNTTLDNVASMKKVLRHGFEKLAEDSEDVGGSVAYSTTEKKIGKWTDGSDLYEITVIADGADSANYQNLIEFPTTNNIKAVSAIFENSNHEICNGCWVSSPLWLWGIAVAADTKRYVMLKRNTSDAGWKTVKFTATIRYTK